MPRLAGMRQPRSSLSSSPLIESSNIVRILRKLSDWSSKAPPRHGSAGITCSSATACNGLWDKVLRACGCLSTPGIAARGSTCVCLLVPQPGRAGRRLRLCMAGPYVATKYISGFQCGPIYGELAIILEFMYVFGLRNAQTSYETAVATVRLRQRSRRTSLWASLTRCAEHRTPWFR